MLEDHIQDPLTTTYPNSDSTLSPRTTHTHISQLLNQHSMVAVFDSKGIITYVNDKFCELYQAGLPELVGKTYLSMHVGYQVPAVFVQLWQEISTGKAWNGEIKIRLKDDTFRWLDVSVTPVCDSQGMPLEFIAIHTDTTRYRQAEHRISELLQEAQDMNEELLASEEELRQTLEHAVAVNEKISESEARYRLISESMRDMICLHQANGTYTYISQSVKTLLGYEPAELLGTSPYALFHPDDVAQINKDSHQEALQGNPDSYIQYRIRKKDGTYTWFETLTHPITGENGQITSLHTASRDISVRKTAEDQRDNFFKHSLELMVMADLQGHILQVNSTWEQTFGYPNQELKGKSLLDFIHPDDLPATLQAKDKEQQSGSPTLAFENRYRCQDGSYRWLSWNSVTYSKDNLMYGFARDITERRQKEEVLKNTLEELKKRNHELDNYVYKVSHDLRAPLTSIMGLINLVKMEPNTPAVQQYISLIENRIIKSDQFIVSIINHSKILNSIPEVNLVAFNTIIAECFEDLKYMPNAGKITPVVELSQTAPFYTDLFRVNIIFKNIISNAIKYLNPVAEQPYVNFYIQVDRQQAQIRIEDNGIGIAPEIIPRMFDMFFRGTPVSDGSGLGLYIVKQTLEQIDGKIEVSSTPGRGTTFTVTLANALEKMRSYE